MLKITKLVGASGTAKYYSQDDYYITGEADEPGLQWGGQGAGTLGIQGAVDPKDFKLVLEGVNPDKEGPVLSPVDTFRRDHPEHSEKEEGDGRAEPKHVPGWDMTFSAPKSVSLVALVGGDKGVDEAFEEAVDYVMDYAEKHLGIYRQREDGGESEQKLSGNLIFAKTMHGTSREDDPQRHMHVIVANAAVTPEGEVRALETEQLYKNSQFLGLMFQAELRHRLHERGYNTNDGDTPGTFEITGFSKKQLAAFSQRGEFLKAYIEAKEKALGRELTDEERFAMRYFARPEKSHIPRDVLLAHWIEKAKNLGLDLGMMSQAADREKGTHTSAKTQGLASSLVSIGLGILRPQDIAHTTVSGAVGNALGQWEERQAVFSRHDLMKTAMEASNYSFRPDDYLKAMADLEKSGRLLAADRSRIGAVTTDRAIGIETGLLTRLQENRQRPAGFESHAIDRALTRETFAGYGIDKIPSASQEAAIRGVLADGPQVTAFVGYAGVGKTTTLAVVAKAVEGLSEGKVQLLGLAPTHKAVQALKSEAGIEGRTLSSFLNSYKSSRDNGTLGTLRSQYQGQWLLVDESSMLGNQVMLDLLQAKEDLGISKLILSGDPKQLSSVSAGAPFVLMLKNEMPKVQLTEIRRQRDETLRSAVLDMAEGRVGEAFTKMAPNIRETKQLGDASLVQEGMNAWREQRAMGFTPQMVVGTNAMRLAINDEIRSERIKAGEVSKDGYYQNVLHPVHKTTNARMTSHTYWPGQVLVFHRPDKDLGLKAGSELRIEGLDHRNNRLVTKGDGGRTISLFLSERGEEGASAYSIMAPGQMEVAAGDKLIWLRNDKTRGITTNAEITVVGHSRRSMQIRDETGKESTLSKSDPMLKHTTHAYAVTTDKAQGQTYARSITVFASGYNEFTSATRSYVQASRPQDAYLLVTNSVKTLVRSLAAHDGVNTIGLEHLNDEATRALKAGALIQKPEAPEKTERPSADLPKPLVDGRPIIDLEFKQRVTTPSAHTGKGQAKDNSYKSDGALQIGDKVREIARERERGR